MKAIVELTLDNVCLHLDYLLRYVSSISIYFINMDNF